MALDRETEHVGDHHLVDWDGVLTPEGEEIVRRGIDLLAKSAYRNSRAHGFHEADRSFGEEIALIHSEATEALEEARDGRAFGEVHYTKKVDFDYTGTKVQVPAPQFEPNGTMNKPEGIGAEFADIIIRVGDSAYGREKLGDRVIEKIRFNLSRPYKNGKRF